VEEAVTSFLQDLTQEAVLLPGKGVKPFHAKLPGPGLGGLEEGGEVLLLVGQGPLQGRPIPEGVEAHVPLHPPLPLQDQAVLQLLGQALEVPGLRGQNPPLGALVHVAEELEEPRKVFPGHGPNHALSLPP
jgi:hypothetical protein